MAGTINVEDLRTSGSYRLVKELRHEDVIEFVMTQIRQLRWPMILFYVFNFTLFILMAVFTISNIIYNHISWAAYLWHLLYGLAAGMLLVIPFHEALHGLAYKLAGAPSVKFGADPRQMMFYASAPGFVTGRYQFYMVAFTPFVLINLVFLSGILLGSAGLRWSSLTALFIHSTMCIGDFAMVNYFSAFRNKEIYTFDDHNEKRSYFFVRIGESNRAGR